jgi:predicted nucleic acid-binding protein
VPATFVVDASVVVEFLAPGRNAAAAKRFIGALAWAEPVELFAPDVMTLEVANAMRKLSLVRLIEPDIADGLVAQLPDLAIATVGSAALLAGAWALRQNMTVFDASYATLARNLSCPLVTTDAKLARACRLADIRAYEVDDHELDAILTALEPAGR